jgi:hypothetical protein
LNPDGHLQAMGNGREQLGAVANDASVREKTLMV